MIKTPLSTVIGGAFWTPSCTVIGGQQSFSQLIKKLFSNGEQGFFYDPNDLSTMYQDAAGTIPVTAVGQPVGLRKDKSGRNNHAYQSVSAARPILQQAPILGSELVVSGDFSNGINEWKNNASITATVENGRAKVTYTGGGGLSQDIPVTAGKTYKVSSKSENISGATPVIYVYGSAGFSPILASSASSTPTLYVTAIASSIRVYLNKTGVGEAYWDDISVKEVVGYRTDQNYIKYDGVDDKLITNLPAQLTGCTVIRSVSNVGTQILTNQTIPAIYEDNKDHCGLIVINRALTATETSQITKLFNKAAGV